MRTNCDCEAFVSAPIRLAAKITERRRAKNGAQPVNGDECQESSCPTRAKSITPISTAPQHPGCNCTRKTTNTKTSGWAPRLCPTRASLFAAAHLVALLLCSSLAQVGAQNSQLISNTNSQTGPSEQSGGAAAESPLSHVMRHHAHYLNIVPSAHFSYNEGRQSGARSLQAAADDATLPEAMLLHAQDTGPSSDQLQAASSHIYKRSSAALGPVAPVHQQHHHHQLLSSSRVSLNPLSRRMMSPTNSLDSAQLIVAPSLSQQQQPNSGHHNHKQASWLGVAVSSQEPDEPQAIGASSRQSSNYNHQQRHRSLIELPDSRSGESSGEGGSSQVLLGHNNRKQAEREAELLRQKQHIQYHDQWPSTAGKCHKRTLNFCASVLPFNTTTFPNIIGDTNRFEVKRSLPFFGFLAKSSCNKRLDELLCLLLEPPCNSHSGAAIPPCKKFCRLALEGCNEYIPATLALSSVFDCRQYPDSNDPSVCINLAQGSKCAHDEFKCPDKTCIPRNWLCDGVRDCTFAADEANCTASAQASVCSTEEFQCDGKCVPKAWKCDGERDCLDGSDEESCDMRPRCGQDRFKCADGNGCIPKRWVCDGKAECRDGSDEMNCEQRQCSDNDFKCDNGICIPKLWRCDRQMDCKDGSDERQCVYPNPTTSTTTTTTTTSTTTSAPLTTASEPSHEEPAIDHEDASVLVNATSSYSINEFHQQRAQSQPQAGAQLAQEASGDGSSAAPAPSSTSPPAPSTSNSDQVDESQSGGAGHYAHYYSTSDSDAKQGGAPSGQLQQQQQQQQLEFNLNGDVSRIIQHESASSSSSPPAPSQTSTTTVVVVDSAPPAELTIESEPVVKKASSPQAPATTSAVASSAPTSTPAPSEVVQSNGSTAIGRDMNKFDYELIQSSSSLLAQMNELPPQTGPAMAVQQQQQQQQQYHQHHAQMANQPVRALKFGADQMQQQQQQQQQVGGIPLQALDSNQPERLPIYRSLFKSLKGQHGRHHNQAAGERGYRNVVSIARRRRDRVHQYPLVVGVAHQQHQQAVGQGAPIAQQQDSVAPAAAPVSGPVGESQQAPLGAGQAGSPSGSINAQAPSLTPIARRHHQGANGAAVASYLQLLNSRYNLRLPHVVSS